MKKIIWYFLGSLALSLGFVVADVITGKVIFNQQDSGLISGAGSRIFKSGNFGAQNYTESVGICSDDAPLLLGDGRCVSCDFNPKNINSVDILLGCEKCPELKNNGIECAVFVDINDTKVQENVKNAVVHEVKKSPSPEKIQKYKLINIMGTSDKMFITLKENPGGKKKTLTVGDEIDGCVIKSISLDGGIIVEKDGVFEFLDVGM